jgi:predicted nucleotidyltransferase component of viral defense system
MITNTSEDSVHKAWLYRILINIADNNNLSDLYFKGGTCAAMRGYLNRFSLDLDFDYVGKITDLPKVRRELKKIFAGLGLEIKNESTKIPQFFLKYPTKNPMSRNTLKIDICFPVPKANTYEPAKLVDIGRIIICQDIKTMFANKLVAVTDRFEKNNSIAGRDIYDIHYFFLNAYAYNAAVIKERTGLMPFEYFQKLKKFVTEKINDTILSQDLNPLLPYADFRRLRTTLKSETLMFIDEEIKRLKIKPGV